MEALIDNVQPAIARRDQTLCLAFEQACAAWPGVTFDKKFFTCRALELEVRPQDLATRSRELFLAWACAAGDPVALAYFEREFLLPIRRYVPSFGLDQAMLDELRQLLRIRLLAGASPRIGKYAGRGPLAAWVRIAAVRLAAKSKARASTTIALEALGDVVASEPNPELFSIKKSCGQSFQTALERSLSSLSTREKSLLRLHFIDRLNIDDIGRIYRVHRATIARWLSRIRKRLLAALVGELTPSVVTSSSEVRSLAAVVRDDLCISLDLLLN